MSCIPCAHKPTLKETAFWMSPKHSISDWLSIAFAQFRAACIGAMMS
jgi:hypothetical protein